MIDYKKQYLKYKFKYLYAKDLHRNKSTLKDFKGGSGDEIVMAFLGVATLLAGIYYFKSNFNNNNTNNTNYTDYTNRYDELIKHYKLLEICENATDYEVKKAYHRKALEVHPDKHKDNKEWAEEQFKKVGNAYYEIIKSRGLEGGSSNTKFTFKQAEALFKKVFN